MKRFLAFASPVLVILCGACGPSTPRAYGAANSLIVAAPDTVWAAVEDTVETVLEPRIQTVRAERTFRVTHVSPLASEWRELRKWKQILVIGRSSDPWIAEILDGATPPRPPAVIEASNVWARGDQRVIALVVPDGDPTASVARMLPELHQRLDRRFREYAYQRMFTSGQNERLEARLRAEAGFSVLVPRVYDYSQVDSTHVFRNLLRGDSDLIRSISVSSRPLSAALPSSDDVLAWRDAVLARFDNLEQHSDRASAARSELDRNVLEVRGMWERSPGSWPGAGVFITRVIRCPALGREFLADAWLFAPGRDKYEYVLQLETILNSFECAGDRAGV